MNRHFLIACFVFSFLFSLFLLGGLIEDFFSYYYAGRSVVWGRDMFADVAQNKGPVSYLFFALLYAVFGIRYDLALVFSSTLLDAIYSIALLFLIRKWTGYAMPKKPLQQWILAGCCIAYIKSFSIGSTMGGVYTEQIAMTAAALSFVLLEKKRAIAAGIIFALAVLTRQSVLWYGLVVLVRIYGNKQNVRIFVRFLVGCMVPVLMFTVYLWRQQTMGYAWENLALSVWEHQRGDMKTIATALFVQTRIFFSILFLVVMLVGYSWKLYREKAALLMASLLVAGIFSVSYTMVWGHQFLQWTPVFFFCFFWVRTRRIQNSLLQWVGMLTAFFVIVSYGLYLYVSPGRLERVGNRLPMLQEITQKKYVLILSAYDKPYIDWQKEAPDRYYLPFLWLNRQYYGDWTGVAIARHKMVPIETLRNTAFVTISTAGTTEGYQWYFDEFGDLFRLHKQASHVVNGIGIDIYESTL